MAAGIWWKRLSFTAEQCTCLEKKGTTNPAVIQSVISFTVVRIHSAKEQEERNVRVSVMGSKNHHEDDASSSHLQY